MNNKGQWIIVILMVLMGVGIFLYETRNTTANKKDTEYPISVSPILQERVETEKGKVLRVTYGQVVLEIPEKYKPNDLSKETKSIIFPLVWPGLTPTRETDKDIYIYRVFIYPKKSLANYDQGDNIDWLLNNNYYLRQSEEYPSLLEYWSDQKNNSYYFIADYKSQIMDTVISCLPDFREELITINKSTLKMGDVSCTLLGVISDSVVVKIRFDARLLPEGKVFHQTIDQLISSFVVKK